MAKSPRGSPGRARPAPALSAPNEALCLCPSPPPRLTPPWGRPPHSIHAANLPGPDSCLKAPCFRFRGSERSLIPMPGEGRAPVPRWSAGPGAGRVEDGAGAGSARPAPGPSVCRHLPLDSPPAKPLGLPTAFIGDAPSPTALRADLQSCRGGQHPTRWLGQGRPRVCPRPSCGAQLLEWGDSGPCSRDPGSVPRRRACTPLS